MRWRLGLATGFAAGYYLGARAGRERYEQINRALLRVRRSEAYETATGKAREAVDTGVERARDLVGSRVGGRHAGDAHDGHAGNGVGIPPPVPPSHG